MTEASRMLEKQRQLMVALDRARDETRRAKTTIRNMQHRRCILCGLPTNGKPYCHGHKGLGG